jgi:hypothetical protein
MHTRAFGSSHPTPKEKRLAMHNPLAMRFSPTPPTKTPLLPNHHHDVQSQTNIPHLSIQTASRSTRRSSMEPLIAPTHSLHVFNLRLLNEKFYSPRLVPPALPSPISPPLVSRRLRAICKRGRGCCGAFSSPRPGSSSPRRRRLTTSDRRP